MTETKNNFRRNIKVNDEIYYKIRILMNVKNYKQYELINKMTDTYIKGLSDKEKDFYNFQIENLISKNSDSK